MISERLLLIKQIRSRAPQVDNFRTPVAVFFQPSTFEAVKSVGDSLQETVVRTHSQTNCSWLQTYLSAAYDTFILVVAERAFVADSDQGCRSNVAVADGTFPITLVAKTTHRDTRLFSTHYQVAASIRQPAVDEMVESKALTDDGATLWLYW